MPLFGIFRSWHGARTCAAAWRGHTQQWPLCRAPMAAMEVEESQCEAEIQEENKKIDMSLDDIIKLQKEESETQSSLNVIRQNGRIKRGIFQNKRYFRNPPKNEQVSGRLRQGFRQQRYPGVTIRNNTLGPITRRRAAASLENVSPLNRPNLSSTSLTAKTINTETQKVQRNAKKYRTANIPVQTLTRNRFNTQNRRSQMVAGQRQQRTNTLIRNRRVQRMPLSMVMVEPPLL
ncbi:hypothetical protein GDO81_028259 [Engystomops pustulosus]|uniref:Forty-two-three domain-containing protein 1 n=1 Tax=Engystomops pustulosus TaxID=76066 RepID=A0AAV6ZER1_ENGPU|nr:hypothetical protein GDO81_028259 [Engystomops pustulosus]